MSLFNKKEPFPLKILRTISGNKPSNNDKVNSMSDEEMSDEELEKQINEIINDAKNNTWDIFDGGFDANTVFYKYISAYLMSGFDKNIQLILFNLFRVTEIIESSIMNIPDYIKSNITKKDIEDEVYNQFNQCFSDDNDEITIENFLSADKDWDEENEAFGALAYWAINFIDENADLINLYNCLVNLREDMLPKAIKNGNTAIDWADIDIIMKNNIYRFYQIQPILFKYSQLNIFDLLNKTSRYDEIGSDYENLTYKIIEE